MILIMHIDNYFYLIINHNNSLYNIFKINEQADSHTIYFSQFNTQ